MANFAFVENNQIVSLHVYLPKNYNNVSNFDKLDNESLKTFGWYPINKDKLIYDDEVYEIVEIEYNIENNEVYATYKLKYKQVLSDEEKLKILESESLTFLQSKWEEVRQERDRRMKDFDWRYLRHQRETRLGITTTDNINMLDEYTQALADVTNQTDPLHINWPIFYGSQK